MKMSGKSERIVLSSDHAGYEMKETVKKYLVERGFDIEDVSSEKLDPSDDYPVYAFKLAKKIASKEFSRGVLLCGSGIGASIAANRFKGVRAALCTSAELARLSRLHNDSNVLVIGGRTTEFKVIKEMIDTWFSQEFEGGRHQRRIDQLDSFGE
jgi:RpiB/LacA/LacB family sugar-phosphate isomerase